MPFQPAEMTAATLKGFVDRHHRFAKATSADSWPPKRAWSQEAIARALGFPNFHAVQAALQRSETPAPPAESPSVTAASDTGTPTFEHWDLTPQKASFAGYDRGKYPRPLVPRGPDSLRLTEAELREHLLLLSGEQERRQLIDGLFQDLWKTHTPVLWIQGASALRSRAVQEAVWGMVLNTPAGGDLPISIVNGQPDYRDLGARLLSGLPWSLVKDTLDHQQFPASIEDYWLRAMLEGVIKTPMPIVDDQGMRRPENVKELQSCFSLDSIRRLAKDSSEAALRLREYVEFLEAYATTEEQKRNWAARNHEPYQQVATHVLATLAHPEQLLRYAVLRLPDHDAQHSGWPRLWNAWALRHGPGVIVLDGLDPDSNLYPWLLTHLPRLEEQGHHLIVTTRSLADLPPAPLTERLLNRLGNQVVLSGPRSASDDVHRLGLRHSPEFC